MDNSMYHPNQDKGTNLVTKMLLVMKFTAFFLVAACLHVSGRGYTQTVTLSLKDVSLEQAFKAVEKQSGYTFVYARTQLEHTRRVDLFVKEVGIEEVLGIIFKDQPISYTISKKFIVVKSREVEVAASLIAQPPIDVKGRVANEKGEPVEGVTVTIKGTKVATSTNSNGEFSLSSINKEAVLVFTSVNMETFEFKVKDHEDILVKLKTKVTGMEEVTVSTGYQTIPKERATGSFAQPDKEIFNARVSTDLISKLEGITSGLVFNIDADGNRQINIRGRSTIFSNDQPLIVVDNFPYDGSINNINPNDIETVTILKDAAAASIWGIRAGNGVIVITTKKGRLKQPLKIEFNSNLTISRKPDLFYDPNFLNSKDFIGVEKNLFSYGFYDADISDVTSPPLSPVVEILNKQRNGIISSAEASTQIDALQSVDIRNDFGKYFYRKAVNQQYAINLTGGSDKNSYFISAGYDKNLTNQVGVDYTRTTLNSFNVFAPTKKMEFTVGFNFIQSSNNLDNTFSQIRTGGPFSRAIYPYAKLSDELGNPLPIVKDIESSFAESALSNNFLNWQFYPVREIGMNTTKTKNYDTRIVAGAKYVFIKGLNAEIKFQYERGISQGRNLIDVNSYYARNLINQFSDVTNGVVTGYNIPVGGILNLANANLTSHSGRGQIAYNSAWAKHSISAIAGIEGREIISENNTHNLYGYDDNTAAFQAYDSKTYFSLYPSGISALIPSFTSIGGSLDRFRSYFSNATYTYNDKYSLSISGRIDQSNYFGVNANQRSVPLWSVGGKWDIDQEKFYHIAGLPHFNFRITYGFNGNLNKNLTAYTTATILPGATFTGATYSVILNPPNNDLRWEKTAMLNLGVDFGFRNQVIIGSIEYFQKKGTDLIGDKVLAPSVGFMLPPNGSSVRGNYANMTGCGLDIQINTKNIDKIFKWNSGFIFSFATDEVTSYKVSNPIPNLVYYGNGAAGSIFAQEGKPVYGIYSFIWGGLEPTTGDPQGYANKVISKDYALLTNPMQLTDIKYNGPARPVFFGGVSNTFSFDHFSFFVNVSYKLGYYFRRTSINYSSLFNGWIGNKDFSERWKNAGDEKNTSIPSMPTPASIDGNREQFYSYSEALVEKGDHIRLQDISFSYSLDKKQLPKLPFSYVQLYVYGNNLGLIWKANKQGLDPDVVSGYPTPKSISFGVRLVF